MCFSREKQGEGLASLCRFRLGPSGLSRGHGLATLLPSSGWLDGPIWLLLRILGSSASLTAFLLLYFFCYWCIKSSHGSIVKSIIKIKKLLYWVSPQAHPASCLQLCPAKVFTERASELGQTQIGTFPGTDFLGASCTRGCVQTVTFPHHLWTFTTTCIVWSLFNSFISLASTTSMGS